MEYILEGKKILIVDDESDVLETLGDLLDMCVVDTAQNSATAKRLIKENSYDAAVLDIMGVDGFELLQLAREKEIPALMLTAHALSPDHLLTSLKGGAFSYIPKDEMVDIEFYLDDIIRVKLKGDRKSQKWFRKLIPTFDKKFGSDWQIKHSEALNNLNFTQTRNELEKELNQAPFALLPDEAKKDLLSQFSSETIKKDTILLVQEISSIEKFLVLSKGSARYYFEQNNEKTLQGELKEGDNFGGISILLNDAVAIRTLKVLEDSVFLSIDASIFLKTCTEFEEFKAYFTNAFGKLMLNKSYAGIIARQIKDKEFNLPFFNQPISAIFRPNIVACPHNATINDAARKMARSGSGAVFIKNEKAKVDAIITDAALINSAISKGLNGDHPASAIASSPVVAIPADSQVSEAFVTMLREDKQHLAVSSKANDIIGTISAKDLIAAQASSTYLLIKTIKSAKNVNQLENIHSKMALMLLDPIRNGANPEYITRLITTFSDAILDKIIEFSIAKLGRPPCKFTFIIMGSEGREEQTLLSDQDNGIIYEDLGSDKEKEHATEYFSRLAEQVCDQLNTAGYKFCHGECMAKNPKWCQSLYTWKKYFHNWIYQGTPEDLLNSSIFFDFKGGWGDPELTDQLKTFLLDSVQKRSGFLRHLTENALHFKPPIGLFGKFFVESEGEHKDSFNIKWAMQPIVDLARVYSLKHGIVQTNTLTRLFRLYTKHVFTNKQYIDLVQTYNYLMKLRFLRQITTIIDEEKPPDNYINPNNLSYLDQAMLKEVFKKIEQFQKNLKAEFIGTT